MLKTVALLLVLGCVERGASFSVGCTPATRPGLVRRCTAPSVFVMQANKQQYAKAVADPYRALGLDRKADAAAIRQAFMNKAKVCHPDVNDSPQAAEDFRKISEAYERLSDAESRRAYDAAWLQMRAGVRDAEIVKPPTPAQAAIIALAGAVSAAPVIIPLTLAHFCVEPFASTLKSLSSSCAGL